jgi:hypothetical protein
MLLEARKSKEAAEEIKQYLIMERINPPEVKAYMLRKH